MAAMNSSLLSYSHTISAASSPAGRRLMPTAAPSPPPTSSSSTKLTAVRAHAQSIEPKGVKEAGRRTAFIGLAAAVFSASALAANPSANAGIFDEYLERSKANKELNDKKRLATSGANLARAYTVEFGTCKFPENFTGCQDLAKQKGSSGANLARAYTAEFGTCKFPENFTRCQDLAKQKKVKFLTEDLEVECEGKDKYKCGSNVFWKW